MLVITVAKILECSYKNEYFSCFWVFDLESGNFLKGYFWHTWTGCRWKIRLQGTIICVLTQIRTRKNYDILSITYKREQANQVYFINYCQYFQIIETFLYLVGRFTSGVGSKVLLQSLIRSKKGRTSASYFQAFLLSSVKKGWLCQWTSKKSGHCPGPIRIIDCSQHTDNLILGRYLLLVLFLKWLNEILAIMTAQDSEKTQAFDLKSSVAVSTMS